MNNNGFKNENVEANEDEVKKLTDFLIAKLDEYYHENPTQAVDAFMALHNFHKLGIKSLAILWSASTSVNQNQVYRMADVTFRKAMRELRQ